MRIKCLLFLAVLWMAACAPAQTDTGVPGTLPPDTAVTNPPGETPPQQPVKNPYAPQPSNSSLTRGEVFIEEKGVLVRESYPPQISLSVSGNLPTPCHELRLQVGEPDENNQYPGGGVFGVRSKHDVYPGAETIPGKH